MNINNMSADELIELAGDDDITDAERFRYVKRAAELGEPKAMSWLGILYGAGAGTNQNYERAHYWLVKGYNAGERELCCCSLGFNYENGIGGAPKDLETALSLYEEGADAGDEDCIDEYNRLLKKVNRREGLKDLGIGFLQGVGEVLGSIGNSYSQGGYGGGYDDYDDDDDDYY